MPLFQYESLALEAESMNQNGEKKLCIVNCYAIE